MPVPSTDGAPAPSLASLIAIAGFKKVYSTSRIEAALDELSLIHISEPTRPY